MATLRSNFVVGGLRKTDNKDMVKEKIGKTSKNQRSVLHNISNVTSGNQLKPNTKKQGKVVEEVIKESVEEVIIEDNEVVEDEMFEEECEDMVEEAVNAMSIREQVLNIDIDDSENPQLLSEYVNDIYDYLKHLEELCAIRPDYLHQQADITGKMRGVLVDWLVQVHQRFHLLQETLFLTISIIDRYLQDNQIPRHKLQLVGVTALWISAKYEELYAPDLADFVYITDNAYTMSELKKMECIILRALDFRMGSPLPIHFLRRFSKAGLVDGDIHTMAKYLMELCLTESDMMHYSPSKLAAASLLLSMKVHNHPGWSSTLEHYSKYKENDLLDVVQKIAVLVIMAKSPSKHYSTRNKYSSSKYMRIAKSERLRSHLMMEFAERMF